ncbi:SMI1/KNR4 family protein [Myroides fluvii]|uniref:SMI1/KNR4 family protein n=1 Tax=Myroides fluvii TaxID=2572594 RepID=UPI00131BA8C6|nr:SMI1/KNR4 family protein [Myroides fluvii]
MKVGKFEDIEKKLNFQDILDFEYKMGFVLPINYRRLILKFNGGLTEESDFFDVLLSIKYGKQKVEDMINMHQTIEQNIPEGYLPIALDWSDNPITINTNEGSQKGEIVKFYFDTDEAPEIIAHSLEELLGVTSIDEL